MTYCVTCHSEPRLCICLKGTLEKEGIPMWNENIALEHKSDVEYLRALEEQRRDLDTEIKKYREKVDVGSDRRLEAWRTGRQTAEAAGIAEARRTGRNHVFMDDGTEVTATPSGNIFYNMADWY